MVEELEKCHIGLEFFSILLPCRKGDEANGHKSVMSSYANLTQGCLYEIDGSSMFFKTTLVEAMTETCGTISEYMSHEQLIQELIPGS